jgi:hypothetical protein
MTIPPNSWKYLLKILVGRITRKIFSNNNSGLQERNQWISVINSKVQINMQHRNVNKYLKLLQISFSKCLQALHSFPILAYNLQWRMWANNRYVFCKSVAMRYYFKPSNGEIDFKKKESSWLHMTVKNRGTYKFWWGSESRGKHRVIMRQSFYFLKRSNNRYRHYSV